MHKIAVLGSRETVMGFKALGLEVFPAEDAEEAKKTFRTLTHPGENYAIIYIEESFAQALEHEIARVKDLPTPAVIPIPGRNGSLGFGQKALADAVERAVGSAI